MMASDVVGACPYKIPGHTRAGCCAWADFLPSFAEFWLRWFDAPPTAHQWSMARQDWKSGNTGFEAAHNAQRRMKETNTPAARQERETRALTRSAIAVAKRPAGVPGTYKDCPTCAHRDNPGARGPCKSCTRLWTAENGGHTDNWAPADPPKRCEDCRATGALHCSDPENCGGPWTGDAQ